MALNNSILLLLLAGLLAGCTTVTSYDSKAEAGPARAEDYPIYVYPEKISVPRPYEIIGTMAIRDTPFTMFGGSFEGELNRLRNQARKKGADALKLTAVEQPDFLHSKFRVTADLIRWSAGWENIPMTEADLLTYLRDNSQSIDPIEGIWTASDAVQSRIGIMRDSTRKRRDFVAFILNTKNPTWQRGDKKLDLAQGERPGVYRGQYYRDDYRHSGVAFSLRAPRNNTFFFQLSEDNMPLIFSRE